MTLSHSSIASACGGFLTLMPALLTRISIRPNSVVTRSTMRATASLSVTSATTEAALTPRAARSFTAAFDFVSLRPTIAMLAPASASPRASPSPIPPLPPVTIATLPSRSNKRVFISVFLSSALALPDQNQSDSRKCGAISRPLDLIDHETRARPGNDTRALTNPEQADGKRCEAGDQEGSAHLSFSLAPRPSKPRVRNDRICRSTPMPAKQCPRRLQEGQQEEGQQATLVPLGQMV